MIDINKLYSSITARYNSEKEHPVYVPEDLCEYAFVPLLDWIANQLKQKEDFNFLKYESQDKAFYYTAAKKYFLLTALKHLSFFKDNQNYPEGEIDFNDLTEVMNLIPNGQSGLFANQYENHVQLKNYYNEEIWPWAKMLKREAKLSEAISATGENYYSAPYWEIYFATIQTNYDNKTTTEQIEAWCKNLFFSNLIELTIRTIALKFWFYKNSVSC
ncbi:hypothetical protein [[Mycoplasma] testudinis]|uniref:hypothetical protein n=1 Tax=[Mycoplasma] testudinis TaxID=33924 RepID=UPI00048879DE|nr:hypothetical protein [[Mycoplasma] testudinis]